MHGKSDASEPQCTTKADFQRLSLMCKIKNAVRVEKTQAWSSRENDTPNSVQQASNHNPTYLWKRASKMVQQDKKSNELQNALPENCSETVDKRKFAQSRCTLTQLLAEQRETVVLMCISVMTPFSLRDPNQRTACARSVRVSPHVCCQVYKVQVSVSNIVSDATGSRVHTTSIHKYPPSVSRHVPRCSILSQHISPMMRPNELPQNPISINTPLGDDDCNVFRLSGMSSYR